MLALRIRAPFAAFRRFSAGAFRPTMPAPPPTALYGLILNLAGLESRLDDGRSEMTVTAQGLPACSMAIGLLTTPEPALLLQQLHNYPVGASGQERKPDAKGNKYNIQPVRRELLTDIHLRLLVDANPELEARARQGLQQGTEFAPAGNPRYGIPFLGDNNLFLDTLQEETASPSANWLVPVMGGGQAGNRLFRLTTWVDRKDMTKTKSLLFGFSEPSPQPPQAAWVRIEPPP